MSLRLVDISPYVFWSGAVLLFVLDFALSLAMAAARALSRVALHRVSAEANGRLGFLSEWKQAMSSQRLATAVLRQLSLLGAGLMLLLGGRSAGWSHPGIVAFALAAVVGVLLLEGICANLLGAWQPRLVLHATSFLVHGAHTLLYPLVMPLRRLLAQVDPGLAVEDEDEQEEHVDALIEVGEREGVLEASEGAMMRGIADLDSTRVREIMTPRTDILALPDETKVAEARTKLLDAGHSRIPVYHEDIDNVIGVMHARDLFRAWKDGKDQATVADYLRPVIHVPEGLSAAQLLAEMRMKTKIALVVDEFGGVSGLVTLEDVLEEIVGEIRDEHDQDKDDNIQEQNDGSFLIKAVTHVEDLEEQFGVEFGERDFDTVGGLLVSRFGRVPNAGEAIELEGLRIAVHEAGQRRILSVRVTRIAPQEADG